LDVNLTCEVGSNLGHLTPSGFSTCPSARIPSSVEILRQCCFGHCRALLSVAFEAGSKLSRIESGVFRGCSSLSSICSPSFVETLHESCFYECKALSSVTFESASKLSRIEQRAFYYC
jgi:hypothetical protein